MRTHRHIYGEIFDTQASYDNLLALYFFTTLSNSIPPSIPLTCIPQNIYLEKKVSIQMTMYIHLKKLNTDFSTNLSFVYERQVHLCTRSYAS